MFPPFSRASRSWMNRSPSFHVMRTSHTRKISAGPPVMAIGINEGSWGTGLEGDRMGEETALGPEDGPRAIFPGSPVTVSLSVCPSGHTPLMTFPPAKPASTPRCLTATPSSSGPQDQCPAAPPHGTCLSPLSCSTDADTVRHASVSRCHRPSHTDSAGSVWKYQRMVGALVKIIQTLFTKKTNLHLKVNVVKINKQVINH